MSLLPLLLQQLPLVVAVVVQSGEKRRLGRIVCAAAAAGSAGGAGTVAAASTCFLCAFGSQGAGVGQLNFPYGLALNREGNVLVSERSNHRIQVYGTATGST